MPRSEFNEVVLPHLDAAFNYARWLTRNDAEAEDVVQDAAMRALRFFSTLRQDDARAWLLAIVRNTWYTRLAKAGRSAAHSVPADEMTSDPPDRRPGPEALALQRQTVEQVQQAVESLPADFREVIVLREFEGLAYKEIAAIVGVPTGTVMSRLSRARERLLAILGPVTSSRGTI
jgi:RNA polymerase sigma-70 factor (ECF subfamily)